MTFRWRIRTRTVIYFHKLQFRSVQCSAGAKVPTRGCRAVIPSRVSSRLVFSLCCSVLPPSLLSPPPEQRLPEPVQSPFFTPVLIPGQATKSLYTLV